MIFAYNPKHVSDTLLVILADDQGLEQTAVRQENVAQIKTSEGTIVGWNFFDISTYMTITGEGQVTLTDEQVAILNDLLAKDGFAERLTPDHKPKIVIGHVESCEPHPDSDHLSLTQTRVGADEVLQIVCGAPNIAAGQKVVVATPGSMMPDGLLIWPGELRGVKSYGMICSAKELRLPDAPKEKGILVLADDAVVGEAFPVGK